MQDKYHDARFILLNLPKNATNLLIIRYLMVVILYCAIFQTKQDFYP